MNSLLVNAGIPQLRVKALAGGRFVYEQKITPCAAIANYPLPLERVDVESLWKKFNEIGGGYAMNPTDFIQKHITQTLLAEGFPLDVAVSSAMKGVDHYHRCSQATRKGKIFDDCLYQARQHATFSTPKNERPKRTRVAKKPAGGLL